MVTLRRQEEEEEAKSEFRVLLAVGLHLSECRLKLCSGTGWDGTCKAGEGVECTLGWPVTDSRAVLCGLVNNKTGGGRRRAPRTVNRNC